jgi:hypothetical protein
VKAWIDSWILDRSNAIALVALFARAEPLGEGQYLRAYLADVARRSRMEFFAQPNDLAMKRLDGPYPSSRAVKRDDRALTALAGIIQRDQTFPRWGINE